MECKERSLMARRHRSEVGIRGSLWAKTHKMPGRSPPPTPPFLGWDETLRTLVGDIQNVMPPTVSLLVRPVHQPRRTLTKENVPGRIVVPAVSTVRRLAQHCPWSSG
jgi:hypothetical protein